MKHFHLCVPICWTFRCCNVYFQHNQVIPDIKRAAGKELNISVPTDGTEGMAELQVECVDRHLITYRQDCHSGEVAGGVGDISTCCHTGQTQSWTWKTKSDSL